MTVIQNAPYNQYYLDLNPQSIPAYPDELRKSIIKNISPTTMEYWHTFFTDNCKQETYDRPEEDYIIDTLIYFTYMYYLKYFNIGKKSFYSVPCNDFALIRETTRTFFKPKELKCFGLSKHTSLKDPQKLKTQKAAGIAALYCAPPKYAHPILDATAMVLIKNAIVFPYDTDASHIKDLFVRPCPTRPRHGFISSRKVTSPEELELLYSLAKVEDPDAEFICMDYANGQRSALLTPTLMTFGLSKTSCTDGGHEDDAAAGVTKSIVSIPTPHTDYIPEYIYQEARIKDTPYIELVEHNDVLCPVQLRDGPAIPNTWTKNYIPFDIVSGKLYPAIMADGNLIQYERAIQNASPDTIVLAPGQSLTTHYAAHAISKGLTFLTDYSLDSFSYYHQSVQAKVLIPKNTNIKKYSHENYKTLAYYIRMFMRTPLRQFLKITNPDSGKCTAVGTRYGTYSLAVAHLNHTWPKDDEALTKLTAHGLVTFIGLYIAALLGELRHYDRRYHNLSIMDPGKFPERMTQISNMDFSPDRDGVFGRAFQYPVATLIRHLSTIETDFLAKLWSPSYGGGNWASATHTMHAMVHHLRKFMSYPCEASWKTLNLYWHTCINEQHNGGYVLNKFINTETFDRASSYPSTLFLSNKRIHEIILEVALNYSNEEDEEE